METNLNLGNGISINENPFSEQIYTTLKNKIIEVLDYSKIKFTNDQIITAIKNAVSIEKEMEAILPKYTNMRELISLGQVILVNDIISDAFSLLKGVIPVMTLLNIDVYRASIYSRVYEIETLEEMLNFASKLQDFTTYFSPAEIDEAIENHSWSEEERLLLNNILLKNDTTTPNEEEFNMNKIISKEEIKHLVTEDIFLGINSERIGHVDRIDALENLIKFNRTKIEGRAGFYTIVLNPDSKVITSYNPNGAKIISCTLSGSVVSGDAALENLLKLGY